MRVLPRPLSIFAWASMAASATACAAVSGLIDYSEVDDAGLVVRNDAGPKDARGGDEPAGDGAPTTDDTTIETVDAADEVAPPLPDAKSNVEGGGDDESHDAAAEAGDDVSEAGPRDASPEASPGDGSTCACSSGICCPGGTCGIKHSNGVGEFFYNCSLPNTFTKASAQQACTASTGSSASCTTQTLLCGLDGTQSVECTTPNASGCVCWGYTASGSGHVNSSTIANVCVCPGGADPLWN